MKKKDLNYFKGRLARIRYYLCEAFALMKPVKEADKMLTGLDITDDLLERVNYYCKLNTSFNPSNKATAISAFKKAKSFVYYADTKRVVRHFPGDKRFDYVFGDVTYVPKTPSFVKSRPISDENQNSVILKLNAIRHYIFHQDAMSFENKLPYAVWRGMVYHQHRRDFVNMHWDSDLANIGHNDENLAKEPSYKGFMSVQDQLNYRYIISIEGKDVATNLKWAMASNSLVMMRRPRFETWFMEGRLIPGVHYVELKDDFSDLEEKINYYNQNVNEALMIVRHAHNHVEQFFDIEQEQLISLLVAKKYFELANDH